MDVKKTTNKDERVRNWTFIVYPESVSTVWRDVLDEQHIQWIESPLHDRDINVDGTLKKPHLHVLLLFAGKKSYEQIVEITESINATIPQKCGNVKGLVRYFTHCDNPEKFQYSQSDVVAHGGADVSQYFKRTSTERYTAIREMIEFVKTENITEFQDLMDYASYERFEDWFPLLCDNSAYVVSQYIKSCRHRVMTVDANGEVHNAPRYQKKEKVDEK